MLHICTHLDTCHNTMPFSEVVAGCGSSCVHGKKVVAMRSSARDAINVFELIKTCLATGHGVNVRSCTVTVYSLNTPAADDASDLHLIRIIVNLGANAPDRASVMTVRKKCELRLLHSRDEYLVDLAARAVIHLSHKPPVRNTFLVLTRTCFGE
jgi:uncharacterized protein YcsI (UPF0317 family)